MDVDVTIPDMGIPGTATESQVEAVERLLKCKLSFEISDEQAHLLLSARNYTQAVIRTLERDGKFFPGDVQILGVATIMKNPSLRDYVGSWSDRQFSRGADPDNPRLRRTEEFLAVVDAVSNMSGR